MENEYLKLPIYIISCKFGYYLSNVIKYILEKEKYKVIIDDILDIEKENLHIILFSQKIKKYPKNYIIYQLLDKNLSNMINKKYELSLIFSLRCWDYSNANINNFHHMIQNKMKLFHLPCIKYDILFTSPDIQNKEKYDLLFYGTMNEPRKKIINYIKEKTKDIYKMKILTNIYGEELFHYIKSSKIILNIHYLEHAILECYRINEVQSCEKLIISFLPNINDYDNYNYYKSSIIFVNSIQNMIKSIHYYLENNEKYEEKIKNIKFIENTSFIHNYLK